MPEPEPNHATSDDLLRTFLATRDTPCPCCNYNLRGLQTTRCPECNQNLHLAVNLTEPRLGGYLAALCGLLAGIGTATVVICVATYLILAQGAYPASRELALIYGIPSLSAVFLLALLLLLLRRSNRIWFRTSPVGRRLLVVLGCWAATAFCVAWFVWAVRRS
jgi:hypothetical protein